MHLKEDKIIGYKLPLLVATNDLKATPCSSPWQAQDRGRRDSCLIDRDKRMGSILMHDAFFSAVTGEQSRPSFPSLRVRWNGYCIHREKKMSFTGEKCALGSNSSRWLSCKTSFVSVAQRRRQDPGHWKEYNETPLDFRDTRLQFHFNSECSLPFEKVM